MSAVLAVFAKAPVAGRVKTRMCPPLTPEQAAALYEAMLLDVLAQPAPDPRVARALWFTPAGERAWFEAAAPDWSLHLQEGEDLPARLRWAFRAHAEQGRSRIVVRGSDSPTLPPSTVAAAFDALERSDLAICPDRDGGYNLIGMRRPADALFELAMSTARVLEETLERARELGLSVHLLPGHHDLDTAEDLQRLGPAELAPRTARWLEGASIGR